MSVYTLPLLPVSIQLCLCSNNCPGQGFIHLLSFYEREGVDRDQSVPLQWESTRLAMHTPGNLCLYFLPDQIVPCYYNFIRNGPKSALSNLTHSYILTKLPLRMKFVI